MKMPYVSNRTKTIDFKAFCKGITKNEESQSGYTHNCRTITAYSLAINPLAFFDVHFMLAAGAVVLVAVLERKLAENGIINLAAVLSGALRIAFPVVAFASLLVLISKLGVFL